MLALVFYALSASLMKTLLRAWPGLQTMVGRQVFLPAHLGYPLSVTCVMGLLFTWYLLVAWNEETERFVVQA